MSLLEDYLKDLNQLETARRNTKFARILSIDFVKGFAITLVVLAHAAEQWVNDDFRWAYALIYACMDALGPSLFIFLSALSVVFSLKKKSGFIPEKVLRNSILIRGVIIIALGVLFNIGTRTDYPFPMSLWGWNILMFIGFSQIICFYILRFSRGTRLILGFMIVFTSDLVRQYLYLNKDINPAVWVLHFIIVSPSPHLTFIPYVSLCFFSTIFGEWFFEAMLLETKAAYMDALKNFIKYGLFFIFLGIAWGGWVIVGPGDLPSNEYFFIDLVPMMQDQPYFKIEGIPLFLVRGTPQNSFYGLGAALMLLSVSFYFIDIKHKENNFTRMYIFCGRVSLSVFFISYLGLFLYWHYLGAQTFFFVTIAYVAFIVITIYILNKFYMGIGTFEWLLTTISGKNKPKPKS